MQAMETQAAAAAYGAEVGVSEREVAVGLQGQDRVVSTISAKKRRLSLLVVPSMFHSHDAPTSSVAFQDLISYRWQQEF